MILVTGAGGKTGKAVIKALVQAGQPVRAWLRRAGQAEEIPETDPIVGDLEDSNLWRQACLDVEALYLICPNMHPQELEIGRRAMRAARAAGVGRFVYHSVLHPQTEDMPHHWQKLRMEEAIFRSGLPFTILQPCAYMQNILAFRTEIAATGTYHCALRCPRPLCPHRPSRRRTGRRTRTHRIGPRRRHLRIGGAGKPVLHLK